MRFVYTLLKLNALFSLLETEHLKERSFSIKALMDKHKEEIAIDQNCKMFLSGLFSALLNTAILVILAIFI